uniref:PCI domain-containing protein n=2 Tax=Phaeomonas parva TaxID=124430 RepID=A0A7S1U4R5_9STRA
MAAENKDAEVEMKDAEEAAKKAEEEEEVEEDEEDEQVPNMALAAKLFLLDAEVPSYAEPVDTAAVKAEVLAAIEEKRMAPLYKRCCERYGWEKDAALESAMEADNAAEVAAADEDKANAETNAGDMEVLDALFRKAKHYARVGDIDAALEAYTAIVEQPKISTGKKIDATMAKIRVALFAQRKEAVAELLEAAYKLVEEGGDWDRRNRLKCYDALHLLTVRDFAGAAALLLECVQTFTAVELCTYEEFIFYTVVTNTLHLPRPQYKKDIIDGPEVLAVIKDLPPLQDLSASLHACDSRTFFNAIVALNDKVCRDRYMAQHAKFLVRELRVKAYVQFLEAYKSVRLDSMAQVFGVSIEFLDTDLAKFIACGRVSARIDRVSGVVETRRPDPKNADYHEVIKKGDQLLNRMQAFARVVA